MRTRYITVLFLLSALTACNNYDWDVNHNTTLSPVKLISEDINADIELNYRDSINNLGNIHTLRWEKVEAADFSTVFYKVLFYTSDESHPVHVGNPEKNGIENSLSLNEKELNIIAEKAFIPQNATGKISWKICASTGINEIYSTESRTITISRPDGYAYYPEQISLSGSAFVSGDEETGTSCSMRKIMREITINGKKEKFFDGEFDVYVYLHNGSFSLKEEGITRRFYISENNELQELSKEEFDVKENIPVAEGKIHYMYLNFKNSTARLTSIDAVELWYSGTGDVYGELTRTDVRTPRWSMTKKIDLVNYPATLPDYRYKFRLTETNRKGNTGYVFLGASARTVSNIKPDTEASYFELTEIDDSRSDYCYKFSLDGHNGKTLAFVVDLHPEIEFYRHYITIVE
jgi:hypothetical protein